MHLHQRNYSQSFLHAACLHAVAIIHDDGKVPSQPRNAALRGFIQLRYENIEMAAFFIIFDLSSAWGLGSDEKLMSNYFKEAGYKTRLVGKWHLGHYIRQLTPNNRGFDSFYGFYNGVIDLLDGQPAALLCWL